jgi:hypothetical protein
MSTTAVVQRLLVVALTVATLVWPPTTRAAASQVITFDSIGNRTTGQALTFNVAPTASSGLQIALTASGSCEVSGFTVSILDKGTCTLQATQDGSVDWEPAQAVSRSFEISMAVFASKTIRFRRADGSVAAGVSVGWTTYDRSLSSATAKKTDTNGRVTFSNFPGARLILQVTGTAGPWTNPFNSPVSFYETIGGPGESLVRFGPDNGVQELSWAVDVRLPDGSPVPGALVYFSDLEWSASWPRFDPEPYSAACVASDSRGAQWKLKGCVDHAVTDVFGRAILKAPNCSLAQVCRGGMNPVKVRVRYVDGDLAQVSAATLVCASAPTPCVNDSGPTTIELLSLPKVSVETDSATINYGAAQTVTAIARNSDGSPIAGRSLTLSASTSGASASCSGRKTTATTNSSGRATFKVCPVKTATWSVDGRSIVGSAGVRLTVQLTPTAPRTLIVTAKTRSVVLAWVAPVKANASSVTDYIVQYRLQGSSTWVTFRDGTSTARKTTVTSLTSGQVYEFRIAAKNKSGTGTWSNVVLGTPN